MIGPLFGAVVLALADWPAIFLINLAVGLVLAAALRATATGAVDPSPQRDRKPRWDFIGTGLLAVTLVFGAIVFVRPPGWCVTSPGASTSSRSPATAAGSRRSA